MFLICITNKNNASTQKLNADKIELIQDGKITDLTIRAEKDELRVKMLEARIAVLERK